MNNHSLLHGTTYKYLGLYFDYHLNWQDNVTEVCIIQVGAQMLCFIAGPQLLRQRHFNSNFQIQIQTLFSLSAQGGAVEKSCTERQLDGTTVPTLDSNQGHESLGSTQHEHYTSQSSTLTLHIALNLGDGLIRVTQNLFGNYRNDL